MSASTRYSIKSFQLSHQTFEDETVIVDLESGSYYSLNKTGTEIWSLLDGDGTTSMEIVEEISRRYEGEPQDMKAAVTHFLSELQQASLARAAESDDAAPQREWDQDAPAGAKPPFEVPCLETFTDMQELLLLDPIHEADATGWPNAPRQDAHEDG